MSKKVRFLLISSTYLALSSLLYVFNLRFYPLAITGFIVCEIAFIWYQFVNIYKSKHIIYKAVYLSIYILTSMMILLFFPTLGLYPRILYIAFSSIMAYLLMVSVNIYLVSEKSGEGIPLLQPAKIVVFGSLMLTVFFSSIIVYKLLWFSDFPILHMLSKVFSFGLFYYVFFKVTKWFYIIDGVGDYNLEKDKILSSLNVFAIAFMTQLSVVLIFYPFENFGRAVIVGGALYITSNLIQNYLAHKINSRFIYESLATFIFVYLVVYFV